MIYSVYECTIKPVQQPLQGRVSWQDNPMVSLCYCVSFTFAGFPPDRVLSDDKTDLWIIIRSWSLLRSELFFFLINIYIYFFEDRNLMTDLPGDSTISFCAFYLVPWMCQGWKLAVFLCFFFRRKLAVTVTYFEYCWMFSSAVYPFSPHVMDG